MQTYGQDFTFQKKWKPIETDGNQIRSQRSRATDLHSWGTVSGQFKGQSPSSRLTIPSEGGGIWLPQGWSR